MSNNVFIFAIGVAVGFIAAWELAKRKYKQMSEETYNENAVEDNNENSIEINVDPPKYDYSAIIKKTEYNTVTSKEEKGEPETKNGPYVITSEEFGEVDDYDTISAIYYCSNGILAESWGDVIDDIEGTVGYSSLDNLHTEDDSVYVRNDRLKTDYEILLEYGEYPEPTNGPSNLEDEE